MCKSIKSSHLILNPPFSEHFFAFNSNRQKKIKHRNYSLCWCTADAFRAICVTSINLKKSGGILYFVFFFCCFVFFLFISQLFLFQNVFLTGGESQNCFFLLIVLVLYSHIRCCWIAFLRMEDYFVCFLLLLFVCGLLRRRVYKDNSIVVCIVMN